MWGERGEDLVEHCGRVLFGAVAHPLQDLATAGGSQLCRAAVVDEPVQHQRARRNVDGEDSLECGVALGEDAVPPGSFARGVFGNVVVEYGEHH